MLEPYLEWLIGVCITKDIKAEEWYVQQVRPMICASGPGTMYVRPWQAPIA